MTTIFTTQLLSDYYSGKMSKYRIGTDKTRVYILVGTDLVVVVPKKDFIFDARKLFKGCGRIPDTGIQTLKDWAKSSHELRYSHSYHSFTDSKHGGVDIYATPEGVSFNVLRYSLITLTAHPYSVKAAAHHGPIVVFDKDSGLAGFIAYPVRL
jgi:hypothetical protein